MDATLIKAARDLVEKMVDSPALRLRVSKDIAVVCALTGDIPGGRATADSLSSDKDRAVTFNSMATALAQVGKREDARALFSTAGRVAQTLDEKDRDPTLYDIADAQGFVGEGSGARRTANLVRNSFLHLQSMAHAVKGLARAGDKQGARELLVEVRQQLEGLPNFYTLATCYSSLAQAARLLGNTPEAKTLAKRSLDAADRVSDPPAKRYALWAAAIALSAAGEIPKAYETAKNTAKIPNVSEPDYGEVIGLTLIGLTRHRLGDSPGSKEPFALARQAIKRLSGLQLFGAQMELIYYQGISGERDGVREIYQQAREHFKRSLDANTTMDATAKANARAANDVTFAGVLAAAKERDEARSILKGLDGDLAVIAGIRVLRCELEPPPPDSLKPELVDI